jgi:hypothetical protein
MHLYGFSGRFSSINAAGRKDCWDRYGEAMISILESFRKGTMFNIHMRENALIYADVPDKVTDMDGCRC